MIYITVKHYIPEIGKYCRKREAQLCGNWLNHQSNVCTRLHHEMFERLCLYQVRNSHKGMQMDEGRVSFQFHYLEN